MATRVRPTQDIQPLTRFRANVASFIDQVRETHRPLLLTQRGRGTAVLLAAADYEAMVDELESLRALGAEPRSRPPVVDRQMLDDVDRILALTPEERLAEVAGVERFVARARRR